MSSYVARQLELMRGFTSSYRSREISLDLLVRRIEALLDAIESDALRSSIFPSLLSIEQVNAVSLEVGGELDLRQEAIVDSALVDLERAILEFEKYLLPNG